MEAVKCEAVLLAAELGSLTAAAQRLGYTQSGITRMLNSLEEELGFTLFIRGKKGVRLTENGKAMQADFREIVRAQHNAEQHSAEICGIVTGSLTIGCYYSIAAMWMPAVLQDFRSKYPGIHIKMQEGGNLEMTKWLREKSVDCCFCAKQSDTDCDWVPLYDDELVVWLPKNHALADAKNFPVKMLETEPFIHTSPGHDTDQDRLLTRLQLKPHTCFTTQDGFTTYNMVEAGAGISFNQRLISQKWNQNVAEIPFDPPQYVSLGIAMPLQEEASPAAKKLIECAKQRIKTLTGQEV